MHSRQLVLLGSEKKRFQAGSPLLVHSVLSVPIPYWIQSQNPHYLLRGEEES